MCMYSIYLSLKPINKAGALAITDVPPSFHKAPVLMEHLLLQSNISFFSHLHLLLMETPPTDFKNYDWRGGKGGHQLQDSK